MIVLCCGCFDPYHYGHLLHFRAAKKYGDLLYVAVTADAFVNKGPKRPVFPEDERLDMIKSVDIVHGAFLTENAMQAIMALQPDVYVKGSEYLGKLPEQKYCEENGIRVVFTKSKVYSSTKLLKHYEPRRSQEL